MNEPTLLVVEDDPAIRRGLVDALRFARYRVVEAADGAAALQLLLGTELDLVLLDVLLPGMSGFSLLEQVRRKKPGLPVIMVTARGSEDDRVRGLSGGADDYVVKPFSAKELLARVEAVLRRMSKAPAPTPEETLELDGCAVLLGQNRVRRVDGSEHTLSEREAKILRYLAANEGRVVSRREILERVWGLDPRGLETRTIDMHVARLREKLGDDAHEPRLIRTIRSKGYVLLRPRKTSSP